ncbi:hypothetical protein F5Y10DRAFT_41762 [Nemania abortiva]|nr:hypothetical protein F5Y10DRAFT_41762 [Nemania abortiva]
MLERVCKIESRDQIATWRTEGESLGARYRWYSQGHHVCMLCCVVLYCIVLYRAVFTRDVNSRWVKPNPPCRVGNTDHSRVHLDDSLSKGSCHDSHDDNSTQNQASEHMGNAMRVRSERGWVRFPLPPRYHPRTPRYPIPSLLTAGVSGSRYMEVLRWCISSDLDSLTETDFS